MRKIRTRAQWERRGARRIDYVHGHLRIRAFVVTSQARHAVLGVYWSLPAAQRSVAWYGSSRWVWQGVGNPWHLVRTRDQSVAAEINSKVIISLPFWPLLINVGIWATALVWTLVSALGK